MKLFAIVFAAVLAAGGVIYGIHVQREKAKERAAATQLKAMIEKAAAEEVAGIAQRMIESTEKSFSEWTAESDRELKKILRPNIAKLPDSLRKLAETPNLSPELRTRALRLAEEVKKATD